MVCFRCISTVKHELESIGLQMDDISLGEVTLSAGTEITDLNLIREQLKPFGFSLLEDKRARVVADVKQLIAVIYGGDFDNISAVFSIREQKTIEKYMIDFRIEKIKEYLVYTPQTLADIAFRLGFSSVAHLSRQFKTFTGLNPSYFKSLQAGKIQIIAAVR